MKKDAKTFLPVFPGYATLTVLVLLLVWGCLVTSAKTVSLYARPLLSGSIRKRFDMGIRGNTGVREMYERGPPHQLSHGKCRYSPLSPAASPGWSLLWGRGPGYSAFVTVSASKWRYAKLRWFSLCLSPRVFGSSLAWFIPTFFFVRPCKLYGIKWNKVEKENHASSKSHLTDHFLFLSMANF